jgi:hypothetical protein
LVEAIELTLSPVANRQDITVIPAKVESIGFSEVQIKWIPAFAGMTG